MKKEDKDFLRELQHELNTQDNEGTAEPLVWGILESKEHVVPNGYGDNAVACTDETYYYLDEFVELVEEYISDEEDQSVLDEWENVDKESLEDVVDFFDTHYERTYIEDICMNKQIAEGTGAFITRRAADEYVRKFGYNHSRPEVYCMCAYRNFELERLLNILKTMDVDSIKEDE